jgi:hypothetical protein
MDPEFDDCVKRMRLLSKKRNEAMADYKLYQQKHGPVLHEYTRLIHVAQKIKSTAEEKENEQVTKLEEFIQYHKDEIKAIFMRQHQNPIGLVPIIAKLTKARIPRYTLAPECLVHFRICDDVEGVRKRIREGQGFQIKLFQKVLLTGVLIGCEPRYTSFRDVRDANAVAKAIRALYTGTEEGRRISEDCR